MALQVWLPLNGNLNNNGLSNLAVTNNGATVNNDGKIGKCYSFNGSDSYVALSGSTLNSIIKGGSNPFSVALWVYQADSTRAILFGDYGLTSSVSFNIEITSTNHLIRFYWAGSPDKTFSDSSVGENTWTHICVTYDGSKLLIYKNGSLLGDSLSTTLKTLTKTSGNYYLGRDNRTGSTTLNGRLNDFRVYDHALSQKEVSEISKGLVLHYKLDEPGVESTTNKLTYPKPTGLVPTTIGWDASKHPDAITVSGWSNGYNSGVSSPSQGYHAYWKIIDGLPTMVFNDLNSSIGQTHRWLGINGGITGADVMPSNTTYTVSFDAKASVDEKQIFIGLFYKSASTESSCSFKDGQVYFSLTTEWKRYSYTKTTTTVNQVCSLYVYGHGGTLEGTAYVRNIQLELKDHATEYTMDARTATTVSDCSGYGNNGTINGELTVSDDSSRHSCCTYFDDGRTNFVNAPIFLNKDAVTMTIWIKSKDGVAGYNSYHIPFVINGQNYEISIASDGKLRQGFVINGTRYVDNVGNNIISDKKWHMIAATYDGTTIKRYVDGALISSSSISGTLAGGSENVYLGRYYTTTTYGSNHLYKSDVRIYSTALSANDIKELYDTSAYIYNNGTLATYDLVENGVNILINKNGIINGKNFTEATGETKFYKSGEINSIEYLEI